MNWIQGHNKIRHPFKAIVNHDGVFGEFSFSFIDVDFLVFGYRCANAFSLWNRVDTKTMYYATEQVYFSEHESGNAPPWENRASYEK